MLNGENYRKVNTLNTLCRRKVHFESNICLLLKRNLTKKDKNLHFYNKSMLIVLCIKTTKATTTRILIC